MGEALQVFKMFFGETAWIVIFFAAFTAVILLARRSVRRWLLFAAALFVIFIFNDLTRKILGSFFSTEVFYRFLWIVPFAVIIAAAVTMLIQKTGSGWLKAGILALAVALFVLCGPNFVNRSSLKLPDNKFLLSDDTLYLTDMIRRDAGNDGKWRLVCGSAYNMEIRCYSEQFETVVDRKKLLAQETIDWNGELSGKEKLLGLVEFGRQEDPAELTKILRERSVDYIVIHKAFGLDHYLASCGCSLVAEGETFDAYRFDLKE